MTAAKERTGAAGGSGSLEYPILLYDGDCGFCTRTAGLIERHIPGDADLRPWQLADLPSLGVTADQARREVLWIGRDGRIRGGAQAFASVLLAAGGLWRVAGAVLRFPLMRWPAHLAYRLIARNRHRLPGTTPACSMPADRRPVKLRPRRR